MDKDLAQITEEVDQTEKKRAVAEHDAKEKSKQLIKDKEEFEKRSEEKDNATIKAKKARWESEETEIEFRWAINRLETARIDLKKLELEKKQADLNARQVQANLKFNARTNGVLVWSIVITVVLFSVLFNSYCLQRKAPDASTGY